MPDPCAAPHTMRSVFDRLRRPPRRIACQFSMPDPWKANLVPCFFLSSENFFCFSGGAVTSRNWWSVPMVDMRWALSILTRRARLLLMIHSMSGNTRKSFDAVFALSCATLSAPSTSATVGKCLMTALSSPCLGFFGSKTASRGFVGCITCGKGVRIFSARELSAAALNILIRRSMTPPSVAMVSAASEPTWNSWNAKTHTSREHTDARSMLAPNRCGLSQMTQYCGDVGRRCFTYSATWSRTPTSGVHGTILFTSVSGLYRSSSFGSCDARRARSRWMCLSTSKSMASSSDAHVAAAKVARSFGKPISTI
mmetsp:Transcript_36143/g.111372  ORF Transcript_36143/g.111372 Transcript_36143/m.111372 type:complete len:311 (-) Transcript_36143:756-1688(-)